MSWTAPPTFVSGTVCTAGNLNILSSDLIVLGGVAGRVYQTTQTGLVAGSTTGVELDTSTGVGTILDGGMIWYNVSPYGLQVPIAGRYQVNFAVQLASGATTFVAAALVHNGSIVSIGGDGTVSSSGADIVACAAGDVLQMSADLVSSSNIFTLPGASKTFLSATLVGAA